ncbi:MAG: Bro-N domain-containing protein [Oxalobacter formigenes]|nr:Bro-N domain-containing protein [Oxalobacter formigenes]
MANSITANAVPFSFESHVVRTIANDGEVWFCAIDVCQILGYSNSRKSIADHCKSKGVTKRYTLTAGGKQELVFINEPNLYRLVIRSKKPEAEKFEEWVMEEVLPQIRKTGAYIPKAYKTGSSDSLSAEQADAIRAALRDTAAKLPKARQQQFMVSGWSKLRAHFGCKYRDIPAAEFQEALSIVARHIAEYLPALQGKQMRPVVWARPDDYVGSVYEKRGMERNDKAISSIIHDLMCWGRQNLPKGDIANSFELAMMDLRGLQVTCWTHIDEALSSMSRGINILNRWQARNGRIGNVS